MVDGLQLGGKSLIFSDPEVSGSNPGTIMRDKVGTNECRVMAAKLPAVANSIKLLQACIYKSVNTGLILTPSVAISIV